MLYKGLPKHATYETVDELTEALADAAGIWGSCPDAERDGCYQEAYCRVCWTMELKQRIRDAVGLEQRLEQSSAKGAQ